MTHIRRMGSRRSVRIGRSLCMRNAYVKRTRIHRWLLAASKRHWSQARDLLREVDPSDGRDRLLLRIYPALLDVLDRLGTDPAESRQTYEQGVELARSCGDRRTEALVEASFAYLASGQNDIYGMLDHGRRAAVPVLRWRVPRVR